MPDSLSQRIADFSDRIRLLPDPAEPPKTTLHILRRGQREQAWQRLLFYFLSPDEPHGLESALLEHILASLSEQKDLELPFTSFEIDDIRVETEVTVSNGGRVDGLIWLAGSWFVCWELKLYSSEGGTQTEAYVNAESFDSIELDKGDFEHHHYLYLAPESASSPSAEAFEFVTWEWIADEILSFLHEGHGQYPARTTTQLEEFTATIHQELTMTEYQEHEREKAQLYFDHYDEIKEAERSFENRWSDFVDSWGLELAQSLETVEIVEVPDLPDSIVVVDCEIQPDEDERWMFFQGNSEWAGIRKHSWGRAKADLSTIYRSVDDREDIRITLYHRPDLNRDLAIQDHTLELQLWHGTGHGDEFMTTFRDRLRSKVEETDTTLPSTVSVKGSRGNPLTVRYDIPVGEHEDFFDAYVAALATAFHDLVIDHRDFVTVIDESFEEALDIFR